MRRLVVGLAVAIVAARCVAAEERIQFAQEHDLLPAHNATTKRRTVYMLLFESEPTRFGQQTVLVRVWDQPRKSWPGSQPQIIQVLDEEGAVRRAKKVGGEPMAEDAWVACYSGRLFVYITCEHRGMPPPGTYIYEIDAGLEIHERGIYYSRAAVRGSGKKAVDSPGSSEQEAEVARAPQQPAIEEDAGPPIPTRFSQISREEWIRARNVLRSRDDGKWLVEVRKQITAGLGREPTRDAVYLWLQRRHHGAGTDVRNYLREKGFAWGPIGLDDLWIPLMLEALGFKEADGQ